MWEILSKARGNGLQEDRPVVVADANGGLQRTVSEAARSAAAALTEDMRTKSVTSAGSGLQPPLERANSPAVAGGSSQRRLSAVLRHQVNFKDVTLTSRMSCSLSMGPGSMDLGPADSIGEASEQESLCAEVQDAETFVQKNKLVIIMVGLPGRGKTFLCNKLKSYLNWLGHQTRHFNVGNYRRHQKSDEMAQDATFFDHSNEAGMEARQRALHAALDDMLGWLNSDQGQVAIFDATNSTAARRNLLRERLHGRCQYLFIETICNDNETLERNYRNKLLYSPDYSGMSEEQALQDFKARIKKYEEVYEPIEDRSFHYIKLIDMVTGRGHMDINRISGYLPGKLVFFLMQVCKAGLGNARKIWLTRHGESEYNKKGLLGGNSNISSDGEKYASALPAELLSRLPQEEAAPPQIWTSTLKRTIQTARHLPFPKLRWKALDEIDAGICDGMTYDEIAEKMPDEYAARKKDKLGYRYPSGESYLDVVQRLEPVIIEVERQKDSVCIVGHQAILRAIVGYFMAKPLEDIPRLSIPLHTLIELTPMPDGTMDVAYFPVDIHANNDQPAKSLAHHLSNVISYNTGHAWSVPSCLEPSPKSLLGQSNSSRCVAIQEQQSSEGNAAESA